MSERVNVSQANLSPEVLEKLKRAQALVDAQKRAAAENAAAARQAEALARQAAQKRSHQAPRPKASPRPQASSPKPTPAQPKPQNTPSTELSRVNTSESHNHNRFRVSKKATAWILGGVIAVGGFGGSNIAYSNNVGGIQAVLNPFLGRPVLVNGPDSLQPKKLSPDTLSPEQCTDPDVTLLTINLDAELKLVPKYVTPDKKTIIPKGFMKEANATGLTGDALEQFKNAVTEDGYPRFTARGLKIGVLACSTDGIIQQGSDLSEINRSEIQLQIKDIGDTFQTPINAVQQTHGYKDVKMNADKMQALSVPVLFAPKSTNGDAAFDKAMTDSFAALQTPDGLHNVLSVIETQATQKIIKSIDSDEQVIYPDGATHSLKDAVDNALVYRITGGNTTQPKYVGNSYNFQPPVDPASKLPMDSLNGFSSDGVLHITRAQIEYGPMKPPASKNSDTTESAKK